MPRAGRWLFGLSLLQLIAPPVHAFDPSSGSAEAWQQQWKSPFCEVSTGDLATVKMSIWSVPASDRVEIYLSGAGAPRTTNWSHVALQLIPGGEEIPASTSWDGFEWRGYSHLQIEGHRFVENFANSRQLVMRDVGTPSSITYSGAEDAMRVFRQCLDTHAREWGVDPARIGSLKARPKLIGDSWMSSGDYPGDALDKNLPGIVVVRLTTNEEGKVTDCAVVQSIATKSMQDVTCQSALKRARFKPAIAADGRASAATFISYINFRVF